MASSPGERPPPLPPLAVEDVSTPALAALDRAPGPTTRPVLEEEDEEEEECEDKEDEELNRGGLLLLCIGEEDGASCLRIDLDGAEDAD